MINWETVNLIWQVATRFFISIRLSIVIPKVYIIFAQYFIQCLHASKYSNSIQTLFTMISNYSINRTRHLTLFPRIVHALKFIYSKNAKRFVSPRNSHLTNCYNFFLKIYLKVRLIQKKKERKTILYRYEDRSFLFCNLDYKELGDY